MALQKPRLAPDPVEQKPEETDEREREYDEAVAESFPASDPPASVIKVGPRHLPSGRAKAVVMPPRPSR